MNLESLTDANATGNGRAEIRISSDGSGEFEPTERLIPLSDAVSSGLARMMITNRSELYVVTAASVPFTGRDEPVSVVIGKGKEQIREEKHTVYTFGDCVGCGAPLRTDGHATDTDPSCRCGYCATPNNYSKKEDVTARIREIDIDDISDVNGYQGTGDQLAALARNGRNSTKGWGGFFRQLFTDTGFTAPDEVIAMGKNVVADGEEFNVAGPMSPLEQRYVYIEIGDPGAAGFDDDVEDVDSDGSLEPSAPSSYIVDTAEDVNDYSDYIVSIESDSGDKLPLVVLTDKDGDPSKLVVPLRALTNDGWVISRKDTGASVNDYVKFLVTQESTSSLDSPQFGRIRKFYWTRNSDRHDQIKDALEEQDFESHIMVVSFDIPRGDMANLLVEQIG